MTKLILVRHGESIWNQLNLFTGWVDVPLSEKGVEEALKCGELLKSWPIDMIYTSTLIRGIMTAMLIMSRHHSGKVPVIEHFGEGNEDAWGQIYSEKTKADTIPVLRAKELNERMYGELQGLNKAETIEKFGEEQVKIWRRSFDIPPPKGESLKMTAARTIPFFEEKIVPFLEQGKNILISAHGNSLRSILMDLDKLTPEEVVNLELATGVPIVYTYENGLFTQKQVLE